MRSPRDVADIEERLRAALNARADLFQPEGLAPLARVGPLRSHDVAPRPDERVERGLPPDVGRDWDPTKPSRPPRLDLDCDGAEEVVTFLAEPTTSFDGRFRMQTTLSSTGEEAYGIAAVGTTIDPSVLDPIDADGDGDQELVLHHDDLAAVGGGGHPLVCDLREGLLVRVSRGRAGVHDRLRTGTDRRPAGRLAGRDGGHRHRRAGRLRRGLRLHGAHRRRHRPDLVVQGGDLAVNIGLEVGDPQVLTTQPTALFYDGASVVVTSASNPAHVQVLVQDGTRMQVPQPVGEIVPGEEDGRTWLTRDGALVTVVAAEDDTWRAWQWVRVSGTEMAAFPTGTVCFDDVMILARQRCC